VDCFHSGMAQLHILDGLYASKHFFLQELSLDTPYSDVACYIFPSTSFHFHLTIFAMMSKSASTANILNPSLAVKRPSGSTTHVPSTL
jgi:hypothetical protein